MWHFGHHFWGMHWMWWILWIGFIVWLFGSRWNGSQLKKKDKPLDILKKRYAEGEIDTTEYEERKKILERDK